MHNQNYSLKKIARSVTAFALAGAMTLGMSVPVLAADTENTAGKTAHTYDVSTSPLAGISAALDTYAGNDPEAVLTLLRASSPYTDVIDQYSNLGIVQVSGYVNVREGTSTDDVICGMVFNNSAVEITSEQDGWYGITSGDVTGYISSDYVVTGAEAQILALTLLKPRAYVTGDDLIVRSTPSTDGEAIGSVQSGDAYDIMDQSVDGWYGIEYGSETGYISAEFVSTEVKLDEAVEFSGVSSSTVRNAIVNYAFQFLGNPYVWGGTSLTNGCDCSGFTMGVLGHFGYGLSHSSAAQRNQGTQIPVSEAQPGDLICYNGHVGICIGGGQLIHAANENQGIIISSIYHMSPICAVNVIGD